MSATPHHLLHLRGEQLDFYLSQGYYRMHQDLFTCQFLNLDQTLRTAHWLRLTLNRVEYGPEQRRLLRANARFTHTIQPFELTEELEQLYADYRASITFDAPETVEAFLLAGAERNVFNTQVLEIRDGRRLIAAGIFDLGRRSMAGIMNFYHPDYRRHSLGKYLMLLKINHAQALHHTHYYPGYVVHQYPKFDYKLFPCLAATEVFDSLLGVWLPFSWDLVAAQSADLLAALRDEDPEAFGLE